YCKTFSLNFLLSFFLPLVTALVTSTTLFRSCHLAVADLDGSARGDRRLHCAVRLGGDADADFDQGLAGLVDDRADGIHDDGMRRSEEHTSELQSREKLVCRLLLEKKKLNMTN